MSTLSLATKPLIEDPVCQGDIFKNVKYSFIDSESDNDVEILEYEFPLAIVVSQACDVTAMNGVVETMHGKAIKYMPTVLLCPIYDKNIMKTGEHVIDVFEDLNYTLEKENIYNSNEWKIVAKDWHYRYHALEVKIGDEKVIENAAIDFKHYFTVPITYLFKNKNDRVARLDDIFSEQITLKFATFLTRVAIPD